MPPITPPVAPRPYLGKGSVLFDRYDPVTNLPSGSLLHMMNVTKFDVEMKDETATQYSEMNASSGLLATALKKRDVILTIEGEDFGADKLAIVHMATGITTQVTSVATVSAEILAAASATKLGRFFRTANRNVDTVGTAPVLTGGTTPTPLVLHTDYEIIDGPRGLFYILPTSAIAGLDTSQLTITYHTLVGSIVKIAGGVVPVVTCLVHFNSDPTDGQKRDVDCWRVNFSPTGQDAFIADDYGKWQLNGYVLNDSANHPNAPFYEESFW